MFDRTKKSIALLIDPENTFEADKLDQLVRLANLAGVWGLNLGCFLMAIDFVLLLVPHGGLVWQIGVLRFLFV